MSEPFASSGGPVRFGAFELEPRSGELRSNGTRVNLPDQPLQLLLALLERRGELVTRDELRQRLWPEDTFVDFEHGLNAAVKRLRVALGDQADRPCFIETVPRRGYRFIAPVDWASLEASAGIAGAARASQQAPVPAGSTAASAGRRRAPLFVMLAVLAITGATWWAVARRDGESAVAAAPPSGDRELTRLTFGPGLQTDVTWSPDGSRIAYASNQAGNFDIWVQAVRGGVPIAVTSSPAADNQPAWSPDGEQIVFRSDHDGGGLFVVSTRGGPVRRLTSFGVHPIWWAGGSQILFRTGRDSPSHFSALYTVAAGGDDQPRRVLAEFMAQGQFEWVAPHPDGRLTLIGRHRTHRFGAFTLDVDGQRLTIVKPPSALLGSLEWGDQHVTRRIHWSPAGNALFVETTSSGLPSLWRVRVDPRSLEWLSTERLTTGPAAAAPAALSQDGRHLAFTSAGGVSRAWVFPFDPASGRLTGEGRPVTGEELTIGGLELSARGRELLYDARQPGSDRVTIFTTDLETLRTTALIHNGVAPVLSRDGTRVSYSLRRQPPDLPDIDLQWALGVRDRSGSERLVSRWSSHAAMMASDWTPDGSALVGTFQEPLLTGPGALVIWPASHTAAKPDRVVLQAPAVRFWQGKFSPDGRWISFVVERPNAETQLGVVAAAGAGPGGWVRIAADHQWPDKPRWAPDGRTMYFLSNKPSGYFNLWCVRLDAAGARPVGEPFQITRFDSPAFMIDPHMGGTEMDIAERRLALTMRSVNGSVWMLSGVDK